MADAGYGGPEVKMQQLKMRLRMIINAIIDQKIHTAGMTEDEAMELMMEEGFQEEGEAAGKWRRACLTSDAALHLLRRQHRDQRPAARLTSRRSATRSI